MPTRLLRRRHVLTLLVPLGGALLAACAGRAAPAPGASGGLVAWPDQDRWPVPYQQASAAVQAAYRFAATHPEVLQWQPCYCGCEADGHTSNRDCFVDAVRADGAVVLDPMGFT
jgi:hypothetical protein